jgi:hypothetical protein
MADNPAASSAASQNDDVDDTSCTSFDDFTSWITLSRYKCRNENFVVVARIDRDRWIF